MLCKGCGNQDAYELHLLNDGCTCNVCGRAPIQSFSDDLEGLYKREYRGTPKMQERMVEQARKERAQSNRKYKDYKISAVDLSKWK